jgi:hypothetical protein
LLSCAFGLLQEKEVILPTLQATRKYITAGRNLFLKNVIACKRIMKKMIRTVLALENDSIPNERISGKEPRVGFRPMPRFAL